LTSDSLFRLPGGVRRSAAVDEWLNEREPELGAIARNWFAYIRQRGVDVRELLHDGCPVACVGDAAFAYVNVFKAHVNVGFYHGADLPDPKGLLEGTGRRMRHVKLRPGTATDEAALEALLDAAYADIRWRLMDSAD
jgi:hypothetical protein